MNTSTPPKNSHKRTGARGGSRTGHKSVHSSKPASSSGTSSSSKQNSHEERQHPTRPRFAGTDPLVGENFVPRESTTDPYLSSKTTALSSFRFGRSIPFVFHSGHDKFLKVNDHSSKSKPRSAFSQQTIGSEDARENLNTFSAKDPQPRSSEKSKHDDTRTAKVMIGERDLDGLKEIVDRRENNKMTCVMQNRQECSARDQSSGLSVVAPQNGNLLELAASGDYTPSQYANGQHHLKLQPDIFAFPDIWGNTRQCPGRSSITPSTNSAASTNSSNGGLPNSISARSSLIMNGKFENNGHDDELSDGDEGNFPNDPRDQIALSNEVDTGPRLGCPFQKHDSNKYSPPNYRSCASSGWMSISRVKEHLYRRHRMPIHCKRCHKQFVSDEELNSHTLVPQDEVCQLRLGETMEGITPGVVDQLKRRKRVPSKQTNEECWVAIYRLLFPHDEAVPDPYVESSQCMSNNSEHVAEFKKYSRLELTRLMRNQLEAEFSLEEDVKTRLLSTIQRWHEWLFSEDVVAPRSSLTSSTNSVTPSHHQSKEAATYEEQNSFSAGQPSEKLAPTPRLLPQPDFDSSSMQGISNLSTITELNGTPVFSDSGDGEGITVDTDESRRGDFEAHRICQEPCSESHVHVNGVQFNMEEEKSSVHDHPMLAAPSLDLSNSTSASIHTPGSEHGWDWTSEEFSYLVSEDLLFTEAMDVTSSGFNES